MLKVNLTYTTRYHETHIKTISDRMSFSSLEKFLAEVILKPKLETVNVQSKEIYLFECDISEDRMAQEDFSHVIFMKMTMLLV